MFPEHASVLSPKIATCYMAMFVIIAANSKPEAGRKDGETVRSKNPLLFGVVQMFTTVIGL